MCLSINLNNELIVSKDGQYVLGFKTFNTRLGDVRSHHNSYVYEFSKEKNIYWAAPKLSIQPVQFLFIKKFTENTSVPSSLTMDISDLGFHISQRHHSWVAIPVIAKISDIQMMDRNDLIVKSFGIPTKNNLIMMFGRNFEKGYIHQPQDSSYYADIFARLRKYRFLIKRSLKCA